MNAQVFLYDKNTDNIEIINYYNPYRASSVKDNKRMGFKKLQ